MIIIKEESVLVRPLLLSFLALFNLARLRNSDTRAMQNSKYGLLMEKMNDLTIYFFLEGTMI